MTNEEIRRLKFRGKTEDGTWLYGSLVHIKEDTYVGRFTYFEEYELKKGYYIIDDMSDDWKDRKVIPETLERDTTND